MATNSPEVWLRGPLPEVPALLQPVTHALLRARDEINELLKDFSQEKLWEKPAGVASVGFHLQHIVGVLDRLFTYAMGEQLSNKQLKYLSEEEMDSEAGLTVGNLLKRLNDQVELTINRLKSIKEETLTEVLQFQPEISNGTEIEFDEIETRISIKKH